MKTILIFLCLLINHALSSPVFGSNNVQLGGSFGHKNHGLDKLGTLNSAKTLTLTIVTGSLANTQLVASYYKSVQGLTIFDQTDMHLQMKGSVTLLSTVFNTNFIEYKCSNLTTQQTCYASSSEVSIPAALKSAIIGILGLEQVLTLKPNSVVGKEIKLNSGGLTAQATTYSYFTPTQVAQVYGFPSSTGAGVRVGIVSLGGYFTQADLQAYFNTFGYGTAPTVKIVYVDGASMNFADVKSALENYLDVEIIASVVPKASITLYFAPNTWQGFYDVLKTALQNNDVVSLSWGASESATSSYWNVFQTLFATYANVPIFIATGDLGSTGGVGFPASCPNAIGTYLFYAV